VTDDSINVAVLTDLSGPIANLGGIDHGLAFKAHFDAVNAAGGIDGRMVEIDIRDMQYSPLETAALYEQVRTSTAMVADILGSSSIDAVAADMELDCLITFMGSPNGQLAQRYTSVFAPATPYGHLIINAIEWVLDSEPDATFALAYQADAFGEAVKAAVEFGADEFGFELLEVTSHGPADQDMTAQVQAMLQADPDYVLYGGLPGQLAGMSAGVFAAGNDMKFITQTGGWTPIILGTPAKEALLANVLVSTAYGPWDAENAGAAQMRDEIAQYGPDIAPGGGAITGWTAALVTEKALRGASAAGDLSLGGIYRAALAISFDPGGNLPVYAYGANPDEPRIPSQASMIQRPDLESSDGVVALTDFFVSSVSEGFVEPK
jgi:branched-chain amino acid transport system substrate-binding protein